jgi:hypothetical protein
MSPIRIFLHMPLLSLQSSENTISPSNTFFPQSRILQVPDVHYRHDDANLLATLAQDRPTCPEYGRPVLNQED